MNSNSSKFSLNSIDWGKILTGVEVALAGAALTYIFPVLFNLSYVFTVYGHTFDLTALAVVLFSALSNTVRKFITDHSQTQPAA